MQDCNPRLPTLSHYGKIVRIMDHSTHTHQAAASPETANPHSHHAHNGAGHAHEGHNHEGMIELEQRQSAMVESGLVATSGVSVDAERTMTVL